MIDRRLLGIYLNDHLMGSTTGLELARRARGSNEDTELGAFLSRLAQEIESDRDALQRIMDDLGVGRDHAKVAAGWIAEKAGRLKLNGQLRGYSPLSRVVELEGLALGITGKLALWRALIAICDAEPRLDRAALERLAERASQQQDQVEEVRVKAVRAAFADDIVASAIKSSEGAQ